MSQQCLPARSRATCTSIYAYGMETIRQTEDVDFALAVGDWSAFARLKQRLIDTGRVFEVPGAQQRLRHASDLPVDLVPFGGVEAADRLAGSPLPRTQEGCPGPGAHCVQLPGPWQYGSALERVLGLEEPHAGAVQLAQPREEGRQRAVRSLPPHP